MSFIGILLALGGLGFLCWLLFTLAIYAFPFFCSLWVGLVAFHSGAGIVGAFVFALIAGVVVFAFGHFAFATARSPILRLVIASLYTAPALVAGYQATLGLARIGTPSEAWCQFFAFAGAIAVGATAWVRLTRFEFSRSDRSASQGQRRLTPVGSARGI
jgi:hypothetical protein